MDKAVPISKSLDKIGIGVESHRLLALLLAENPELETIMRSSRNEIEALIGVRDLVMTELASKPAALAFVEGRASGPAAFEALDWSDYAAVRLLDYVDNAGREFEDLNLRGERAVSNPIKLIWLAVNRGTGGAKPDFFEDMVELFRQQKDNQKRKNPERATVEGWMARFPSGLDPRIVKLREENRDRILNIFIAKIDAKEIRSKRFAFDADMSQEQKFLRALKWWGDARFHLRFAVRSPALLDELLDYSLDPDTMSILEDAEAAGIPFFVNPYYLSLLHVRVPYFAIGADLAIRDYVLYSRQLVDQFGDIHAWEKEDIVEPGKPNAAGWILPSKHSIHRRYPGVAILIPASKGRACGGLCSSCQRMYDFQRGNLNFDLDKLAPTETFTERLERLMIYFRDDSQLRDILITGGDALMSSNKTLHKIFAAVLKMVQEKREANATRPEGEKYAEIQRVRLGTRLPVYLPQRITPELVELLADFKHNAAELGVRQFIIQTHFESPLEVTPEASDAIARLHEAGWTVTNQLVFTAAASRRGHSAKLRQVLGEIGVLPYYTFSVKGYMENWFNFATNARIVQERQEEKVIGKIPVAFHDRIREIAEDAPNIKANLARLLGELDLPFPATDRSVLNLPGVGKSMTFRSIGITRYGRRVVEFDHDPTREHSPIIEKMGKVVIIESKSIREYLDQLGRMGEDVEDYRGLYGYSIGVTEPRMSLYEYPDFDFSLTDEYTNLEID